jgi:capsular polysaccharide biosynthesis protein
VNDSEKPTGVTVGAGVRDGLPKPLWGFQEFPAAPNGAAGAAYADDPAEATDAPASKLVSLGDISAAIKRSKLLWCIAAVVGLLLGSALFVSTKPVYQVSVSILITNDPSQDPVTQQATNALLAQSPTLGAVMVKKLGLHETPATFLKTYSVTVTSNQVLTIAVGAPTAAEATNWAAALGTEFLQFRASTLQDQQSSVFAAENQQLTQEQQALASLNEQISQVKGGSTTAGKGASLAALQAKQAKATVMVTALEQTVATSQAQMRITTTSMISGSSVLNTSPAALAHAPKKTLIEYVGGGLIGGLVVGMGIIAVRAIATDRLRRRSDIAEALGAPIRVSVALASTRGKLLGGAKAGEADGGVSRVVANLRNALPGNTRGPATLAIVAVDNSKAVAPIVVALAAACAGSGKRVMVADLSGGALAEQLGETRPGVQTVTVNQDRIMLVVPAPGDIATIGPLSRRGSLATADKGVTSAYSGADILITLAVLDPGIGADHLSTWANEAVAVVTAGESTTVKIHATGEMIRGAGIHLASAVLLGADRADQSLGMVG